MAPFHGSLTFPAKTDARFSPGDVAVDLLMGHKWSASISGASNIENLAFSTRHLNPDSPFNTEGPQWLEVLRRFSAAKSLSLKSMYVVPPIAFALKQVIEKGVTDVLPAVQELSIFRSLSAGPVREAIEQFVAARGLSVFETPAFSGWRFSAVT